MREFVFVETVEQLFYICVGRKLSNNLIPHLSYPHSLGVRVSKTMVSLYEKNLLDKINFSHFAGILPSGQLYRDSTTSTHIEELMHSAA
jgi:hypothetical protein